jgi:penicillin G amidase
VRILRIILLVLLLILVVIAVGGFVFFNDTTRGPLPQTSGNLTVPGLTAQVEVLRDAYGVPHIYGSNLYDLFFAQGYTQAQDRWWQMEFWRHTAGGQIQELTGKTESLMGTDVFIRTVGWRRSAERDFASLDEETRALLQAFADGVNAYTSSRSPDDLAFEYRILGVTGVNIQIEPWTPIDSLAWGKVMAWNLTDSYDRELTRESLLEAVGPEMTTAFAPPWPYGERPTILQPEDLPLTAASLTVSNDGVAGRPMGGTGDLTLAGGVTAGEELTAVGLTSGVGIGSNNWVATGTMTETGLPLLANDPHLGIMMPSIWYEIGLHCLPLTEDCPLEVVGFALSASPGVVIGHNANIAWGVTNVGADVQDLYRIKVNPENPFQYEWNGEWRDMTVHDATLNFGDGETPVNFQVRETHLGPIINDNRRDPETGELLGFNNEDPLALRWTGFETGTLFQSVLRLNFASDWESFRDALTLWDIPSQNFVYADVQGNIGYQTPGRMPIRAADHDGLTPVDGSTDAYEWRGYIPFDNLPRIYNPARQYIVTANQAVVPQEYYNQLAETLGEDANYQLSYDWSYGFRGQRINDMLQQLAPNSVEDYRQIQGDNLNLAAQLIVPYLSPLTFDDANLSSARDWLASWDYQNNMSSGQAALFEQFAVRLLANTFGDQLPDDVRATYHQMHSLIELMEQPDNPWWDDTATDPEEFRDDILTRSFREGYEAAVTSLGANRDEWTWGKLHTATFVSNPLGASGIDLIENMVNRGPVETSGGGEIVNATGWSAERGDFTVGAVPSMRMIIDVSNFDNSRTIHTTGQSGHPFSPHYGDMIDMWRNIENKPMLFSREAVEQGAADRLILNPAG